MYRNTLQIITFNFLWCTCIFATRYTIHAYIVQQIYCSYTNVYFQMTILSLVGRSGTCMCVPNTCDGLVVDVVSALSSSRCKKQVFKRAHQQRQRQSTAQCWRSVRNKSRCNLSCGVVSKPSRIIFRDDLEEAEK